MSAHNNTQPCQPCVSFALSRLIDLKNVIAPKTRQMFEENELTIGTFIKGTFSEKPVKATEYNFKVN